MLSDKRHLLMFTSKHCALLPSLCNRTRFRPKRTALGAGKQPFIPRCRREVSCFVSIDTRSLSLSMAKVH